MSLGKRGMLQKCNFRKNRDVRQFRRKIDLIGVSTKSLDFRDSEFERNSMSRNHRVREVGPRAGHRENKA